MTLTEIAFHARNFIKYGALLALSSLLLYLGWQGAYVVFRMIVPEKPPPPQVSFNRLPSLVVESPESPSALTYTLETPTREVPVLPTVKNVYLMPVAQTTFLNLDETVQIAQNLGFSGQGTALTDVIYRFNHPTIPSFVDINIVNKTFSISYNLEEDPSLLALHPTSKDEALASTRNVITAAVDIPIDLDEGSQTYEFLRSEPQNLQRVSSLSEANFVRVNFFRRDYDSLPVITPRRDRSTVWFLATGESFGPRRVIAGEYHYFPVDEGQSSTYPLKTSQAAWQELQSGGGFVLTPPREGTQAVVRRIYLAYYDSGRLQQFLQPVFVFDGDLDFRAMVPAVAPEYYGGQ